jgi:hypothetical protein
VAGRGPLTLGLALVGAVTLLAAPSGAATLQVRNDHNTGPGSLRRAIERADAGDTIKVPAGHYELTSGALAFDKPLRIVGAGARRTVIDANGASRVFEIGTEAGTVRLTGITIREGDTQDDGNGGGIEASNPKLILTRVAVLANRAEPTGIWYAGGIYGTLVIARQSLFAGNVGYNGGAISADEVRATDSTFYRNFAGTPDANGEGGAVDGADVRLVDSTVAENRCFNGEACGAGVYSDAVLKGTVMAANFGYEPNGIPAGQPGNPGLPDNCAGGPVTSQGHNLDDQDNCGLSGPGDIPDQNPRLGPLRYNGGPTKTLLPRPNSPAINAGARQCTRRDQRGVERPQGRRCDIGAVEIER